MKLPEMKSPRTYVCCSPAAGAVPGHAGRDDERKAAGGVAGGGCSLSWPGGQTRLSCPVRKRPGIRAIHSSPSISFLSSAISANSLNSPFSSSSSR